MAFDLITDGQAGASVRSAINGTQRSKRTVIFGDSITAACASGLGGATPHQKVSYFCSANAMASQRLSLIANAGIGGNTTTQMLARLESDVLSLSPNYVVECGGVNDSGEALSPGDASTAGTSIYNLNSMYRQILATGAFIFICAVPPTDAIATNNAFRNSISSINAFKKTFARENPNCVYVDVGYPLIDPATNAPRTGYNLDGVHPTPRGAMVMAMPLAKAIIENVPLSDDVLQSGYEFTNYAPNPYLAGDNADTVAGFALATGVTGTGPSMTKMRTRGTVTAVCSKVASVADSMGFDYADSTLFQMVLTTGGTYSGVGFSFGGDDIAGYQRYDQTWGAQAALSIGDRKNPTTPNGYNYRVITAGTTGAEEPTWPTTEGFTIADGTVVYLCQKKPAEGDQFYAEAEIWLSGLSVAGMNPMLSIQCYNKTNTVVASSSDGFADLSGDGGKYSLVAPNYIRLRTPVMTLPSFGASDIRYLLGGLSIYGDDSGTEITMKVGRCAIMRVI